MYTWMPFICHRVKQKKDGMRKIIAYSTKIFYMAWKDLLVPLEKIINNWIVVTLQTNCFSLISITLLQSCNQSFS